MFLFVTSFMDFLASFFLDPTRVVPTAAATWHTAVQWMAVTSHAVLPATETTKEVRGRQLRDGPIQWPRLRLVVTRLMCIPTGLRLFDLVLKLLRLLLSTACHGNHLLVPVRCRRAPATPPLLIAALTACNEHPTPRLVGPHLAEASCRESNRLRRQPPQRQPVKRRTLGSAHRKTQVAIGKGTRQRPVIGRPSSTRREAASRASCLDHCSGRPDSAPTGNLLCTR